MRETETQRNPATDNEFFEKVSCFPKLPLLRPRGVYPVDSCTTQYTCRKLGKSHKSLLPGVVTMHCQHGKYSSTHNRKPNRHRQRV